MTDSEYSSGNAGGSSITLMSAQPMTDKDSEFESDSGSGITSVSVQEPMSGKELCARLRALNPVLSSQDIELKQQLLAKEKTFKASHETCSKEAILTNSS